MSNYEQDPAAVAKYEDRAGRLYAVYGGAAAQAEHDARDRAAAARLARERMAVEAAAAFAAPVVTDHKGRLI